MLCAAAAFQVLGGMAPCHLCLQQRWAHAATIALALAAACLPRPRPWLAAAAALALLAGAGTAAWHAGVERHWWASACAIDLRGIASVEDLRRALMAAPVVRCDDVAWSLLGLSMAAWNGLLSAAAAAWALAALARRGHP
jgi:disulfide bond formation protein DsbB